MKKLLYLFHFVIKLLYPLREAAHLNLVIVIIPYIKSLFTCL